MLLLPRRLLLLPTSTTTTRSSLPRTSPLLLLLLLARVPAATAAAVRRRLLVQAPAPAAFQPLLLLLGRRCRTARCRPRRRPRLLLVLHRRWGRAGLYHRCLLVAPRIAYDASPVRHEAVGSGEWALAEPGVGEGFFGCDALERVIFQHALCLVCLGAQRREEGGHGGIAVWQVRVKSSSSSESVSELTRGLRTQQATCLGLSLASANRHHTPSCLQTSHTNTHHTHTCSKSIPAGVG